VKERKRSGRGEIRRTMSNIRYNNGNEDEEVKVKNKDEEQE
jgi:hypothetical protein